MQKLFSLILDDESREVTACLSQEEGREMGARQLATKLISSVSEDDLGTVYAFLSDLAAEMAALSDCPKDLSEEHSKKISLFEMEFKLAKEGLGLYRLNSLARKTDS